MNNKFFGSNTGLRLLELAWVKGNLATHFGHSVDRVQFRKIFNRSVETSGYFIDTVDIYQTAESQEILSNPIEWRRDELVLFRSTL